MKSDETGRRKAWRYKGKFVDPAGDRSTDTRSKSIGGAGNVMVLS